MKNSKNSIKNEERKWLKLVCEKDQWIINNLIKIWLYSLIRGIQIKAIMRYNLIPETMAQFKNTWTFWKKGLNHIWKSKLNQTWVGTCKSNALLLCFLSGPLRTIFCWRVCDEKGMLINCWWIKLYSKQ